MPDDTTDPRDARDPNHIWLRQSVTFSVNGQTRTLELALPLRPGATPDEVDALLDEADAGMRRLSQRLDAHLAEISGAPTAPLDTPSLPPAQPTQSAQPASQRPAPRSTPATAQTAPRATAPAQPAAEERPAPQPAARPARPAAAATPAAAAASPASAGPDLTRPEFLAAVSSLGLDARTVMERLKVRSLNGLNLRETLDLLRRQALREGSAEPEPMAAAPAATSQPTTEPARPDDLPTPIGVARFDEEEDGPDFELSYPDPDDLPGEDEEMDIEDFAPQEIGSSAPLSDVPDLDDLLAPAPAAQPTPAATPAPDAPAAPPTSAPVAASEPAEDGASSHAQQLITALRTAHPGGQPSGQQQKAYRNIVVEELGEKKASSIVRALWNVTPDKLSPEQYDQLIRWGKQDTFADEVEQVLEVLRAEWLAQHGGAQTPATAATPSRQPAPSAPQSADQPQAPARPATRGRSASRANANGANGSGAQGGA
ncbi:MAG TPA: hypothetical protein VFN78_06290 [Ktedonobacterales bacterium]|nr:hypothetical protein [Ktedonobacterales bacterium]